MTQLSVPAAGPRGPHLGQRVYRWLASIPTWILWGLVIVWSVPTFGLFVNSFRARDAQIASGWWTGGGWTLDNYAQVLTPGGGSKGLSDALLNSLAISLPATVIPIAIAAFAAYAFAWIPFKGREWSFVGVVALMAIPAQMSLIPLLQLYSGGGHWTVPFLNKTITVFPDLSLAGQISSVWITHTGFALPFAIFLIHNYISQLPKDVFESARIDGADHFTIFWRLVVPLSVPVLAAFAIFQFLWTWNDYLIALTMIGANPANIPATVRIASLAGEFGVQEHVLTAGAFVTTVLPLVVFFSLQRYFVRGILAGSVKG
ncbi:MAG: carbohydrate ABC transporter permease [Actinobacteria bacterium]|nr:carbohydrate ABC transporter permease [Actinomycetota bacterium]